MTGVPRAAPLPGTRCDVRDEVRARPTVDASQVRRIGAAHRGCLAWLLGAVLALARASDAAAQAVPGTAAGSQTGDGGGAWTQLASAPEANLFTGVAQASVPIEVPPGRQAAAPALALAWSSNAGPGPIGYGWSLPLPRVHRSLRSDSRTPR